MKVESVVVYKRSWSTIHDPPDTPRVRYFARITFEGGVTVRTTRLSTQVAEQLVAAGATGADLERD